MSTTVTSFTGDVPQNYHAGLGPLLFEPYAEELARRLAAVAPRRVLETACGTGILTRRLAGQVPPGGRLVATDLNEPMLAQAKKTLGAAAPAVDFRAADMTALAFEDGEFDAVVCQFGLMFVPDKLVAVREALRVLAPGGTFVVATWSPVELNDVCATAFGTVRRHLTADPPKFMDVPFSLGDPTVLRGLLGEAGFVDVAVEAVPKSSAAGTARDAARGHIEGSPLVGFLRERDPSLVPLMLAEVEAAIAAKHGTSPVRTNLSAVVATARKRST